MRLSSYTSTREIKGTAQKKFGCLGCLGMIMMVLLVLLLGSYYIVFHSSLPVKWVAQELAEESRNEGAGFELNGVGGSISSGLKVKEITIHSEEGDSTIEGFKFQYNGLLDVYLNDRFVIKELSTQRAEFVVASSFFDEFDDEEEDAGDEATGPDGTESEGESLYFELRELRFENTRLRSPDGEIDINIPLIRLAGLKIDGDEFGLDELEVDSDHIQVELSDASPEMIEGQKVPFAKKVSGSVSPRIHPLVKSDIDFSFEFAAVNGATSSRIIAFGGALEQTLLPDGVSLVRFRGLSLGDFFHSEDIVMPEDLTFTARQKESRIAVTSGDFTLGKTRFKISSQEVDEDDPQAAILGRAQFGDYEFEARIKPSENQIWPPFVVELSSKPGLQTMQLLAKVYFLRDLEDLNPEQEAKLKRLHDSQKGS